MKLVLYGISCSGKDTFINTFLTEHSCFKHIHGSKRLSEISNEKYGADFQKLPAETQNNIRKAFVSKLTNMNNIIVDGHYCFPSDNGFETVFSDEDKNLYDVFLYLRVKPEDAHTRISVSDKNKKFKNLCIEEISQWQDKEISELRDICFADHKEFIVLDEDFNLNLQFLNLYISSYPKMTAIETARHIVSQIKEQASNSKKIALFDCDRTITKEDTTIPFFELNNGHNKLLKEIFRGDVYTQYQFWRQQELYKNFSVYPEIKQFTYNNCVLDKLELLKNDGYSIFGLTAGIYNIWKQINGEEDFFTNVIGNNLKTDSVGIITDFVKGYVVELLQNDGFEVFSTGDSMCDIYMLEKTGGLIWAPEKVRPIVQKYITEHSKTSIKQYKDNPYKYEGITEVA